MWRSDHIILGTFLIVVPKCDTRANEGSKVCTLAQHKGKKSIASGMHGSWSTCEVMLHPQSESREMHAGAQIAFSF